eukprot:4209751-Alexandrium_andersonii.AAC.1
MSLCTRLCAYPSPCLCLLVCSSGSLCEGRSMRSGWWCQHALVEATKESSVKYKTKEYKQLDANVVETSSDREGVQAELTALLDYNKCRVGAQTLAIQR